MSLRSNEAEKYVDNYGPVKQAQKGIQSPMGRIGGPGMASARRNSQIFTYDGTPLQW